MSRSIGFQKCDVGYMYYELQRALIAQGYKAGMWGTLSIKSVYVWSNGKLQDPYGIVFKPLTFIPWLRVGDEVEVATEINPNVYGVVPRVKPSYVPDFWGKMQGRERRESRTLFEIRGALVFPRGSWDDGTVRLDVYLPFWALWTTYYNRVGNLKRKYRKEQEAQNV